MYFSGIIKKIIDNQTLLRLQDSVIITTILTIADDLSNCFFHIIGNR